MKYIWWTILFKCLPLIQSLRALPHWTRQFVSEQDIVQSMYWISHCSSHFSAISSSLKTQYNRISDQRHNSRAGFGKSQVQKICTDRAKKQYQYFISHNYDEEIVNWSNIKENLSFAKILMTLTFFEILSRTCPMETYAIIIWVV